MTEAHLHPHKASLKSSTDSPMPTDMVMGTEARYSALPLKDLIRIRLKDLGLSNIDLQKALGYPRPNVIAMIKVGSMRLPEAKAVITADLLQVDRTFLMNKVIAENNPDLWDALSLLLGDKLVTANELALIRFIRTGLNGHDADLVGAYDFGAVLAPVLAEIFKRESALAHSALDRDDT